MRIIGCIVVACTTNLMGATTEYHRPAIAATAQVPLSFERATSGDTHWMARGNGYRLAVGAADVEVGLRDEQVRILFVGADSKAPSVGLDALPGKVNYFIGSDPKGWLRDISTYARVRYNGVYPGVDMVWYGKQGRLEYDMELQPGADPSRIAMRFEGARKLLVETSGDLRVDMAGGSLSLKLPEVYQQASGGRRRIDGRYELRAENQVGFHLAPYDKSRPLVIDPTLVYATYFGSGYSLYLNAVAVDGPGNVYIGGSAFGGTIPTVNALQPGNMAAGHTAYISKFDPTGKTILYSTYLGGSGGETVNGLAVDSAGNLVGVGTTSSKDFPLINPAQAIVGQQSAFAFKLNAAGNSLFYSTYLGGSQLSSTAGTAVAVDASGDAYVTGSTNIGIRTTPGALDYCTSFNSYCTFVVKLSSAGAEVYAAVPGGLEGYAIAVDAQGAAYVAGATTDTSFPNNPPGARKTNAGRSDAFVVKLSPDAGSYVWATFLGGSGDDSANAIALGAGGVVYFGGQTASSDLPVTTGVVQRTYGGNTEGFVASLSADGTSFGFVTYLGGRFDDAVTSLAAGANGLIVAGNTSSRDLPVSAAIQPAFPGPPYAFLKSTNSGASFTAADNGLPFLYSNSTILPDPSAAGVIVLDTGASIYRSTDDGTTWVSVEPYGYGSTVRSLSNPSVLYASGPNAGCDLFKSTDGGKTWSMPCYGLNLFMEAVGVSPTDPNMVLLFYGNTEYRSTNGGQSFQQQITLPFWLYSYQGGRITASPDGSMYATTGNWGDGLYKSTDVGLTWTKIGPGLSTGYLQFALSPSNPSILYAAYLYGSGNIYRSTNAGTTWNEIATGVGATYLAVDPSNPQIVYGTSSYGLLISTDGGATWTPTGAILDSSSIYGFTVSRSNGEVYLSNYVPQSGFVAKLTTDGKALTWSTYYGPYSRLTMGGAALAPSGDVWIAGTANSGSLPLTPDARNGNTANSGMAFLARMADTTASCSYTVSPATQYSYSAGQLVFSVTAPSGCAWTATASANWIHLIRSSGTGSGTIPLGVDANTTATTRTGAVSVNGQVYTITQPASSCTYELSTPTVTSAGGTVTITVTAPAGCTWDVELQNGDPATVTSATTGTGNGTITISIPPNLGVNSDSFSVVIGGQYLSLTEPAGTQPKISGVISAGAFGAFSAAAPGSWVEIYGTNLASTTGTWAATDFNGNSAPTSLGGVQVTIGEQSAFIDFASPFQVNAQLPSNIGPGSLQLTVTNAGISSLPVNIAINATQSGLLAPPQFKVGANQYVVAQFSDGSYVLPTGAITGITSRPAKPGETIVIYGVGFGSVVPNTPAGQIATGSNQLSATVQFLFGQTPAVQVPYAGLTPGSVGLYQFNIKVPQVPDNDLVPLTFNLGGVPGTQTLYTAVHQ